MAVAQAPEPWTACETDVIQATDAAIAAATQLTDASVDQAINDAVASASTDREALARTERRARGLQPGFFARWDTDGNGTLDRSEVSVMLAALRAEALGEREDSHWCVLAFEPVDSCVAPCVAAMEMEVYQARRWAVRRLQPEEEEIDAAMAEMDSNRDGVVTTDEFEVWWLRKGGWEYASQPAKWI